MNSYLLFVSLSPFLTPKCSLAYSTVEEAVGNEDTTYMFDGVCLKAAASATFPVRELH